MRQFVCSLGLSAALLVALPVPAWAQPSFEDDAVPADSDVTLELKVPEDREDDSHTTVRVDVSVPDGFTVRGCAPPRGWDCVPSGNVVRFRSDRSITAAPTDLATYGLLVHTPGPGTYGVRTVQWYSDDHWTAWTVQSGTAPTVHVIGVAPTPTSSPSSTSSPTPTPTPRPTTKPTATATTPTSASPSPRASDPSIGGSPPASAGAGDIGGPGSTPDVDEGAETVLDRVPAAGDPVSGSGPVPDDATIEAMTTRAADAEQVAGRRRALLLIASGMLGVAAAGIVRERARSR